MKTITTWFLITALVFARHSGYSQLPFTVENMQNFSSMNQADFINAMKAFPDFKEEVANRTEYNCEFDESDAAGHGVFGHFILIHDKGKKDGRINTTMSSFFIAKYIDSFALSLKSKGYKETTDSSDLAIGYRVFNKRPFDFYLPTPQKGHKGILVMNNVLPPPPAKPDWNKAITTLDVETVKKYITGGAAVENWLQTAIALNDKANFDSPEKIQNHLEIIKLLIDRTANINQKDNTGHTILYNTCDWHVLLTNTPAVLSFYAKVAELLLEKGANPNIGDDHGTMPVVQAIGHSYNAEMVRVLLAHGADKNIKIEMAKGHTLTLAEYAKKNLSVAKGIEKENLQAIVNMLGGK